MADRITIDAALVRQVMEALTKLLGPADDPNIGWRGNGTTEHFKCEYCGRMHGDCTAIPHSPLCPVPGAREALTALQSLTSPTQKEGGEPVLWQYRWTNPASEPHHPPSMTAWEEVKPPHWQTLEQKLEELRAYRFNGVPCYEVRPLFASPVHPGADDEVRRDAERYRFLCEQDHHDTVFIATGGSGPWGECGHSSFGGFKDLADKTIDSAMHQAPKEG